MNSHYQNVGEKNDIQADNGSFQIKLAGNTSLVHIDSANTFIGEMIVAGVEKGAELLGIATPAAQVAAQTTRTLSTNPEAETTTNVVYVAGH